MIISLIVAATENNVIGKDNKLLWRLPNDLKFFKNTTWGMPLLMGRKTFESISPEPLPGRYNIVITRNGNWNPKKENLWVVHSIQEAIEKAKETDCKELFIAGGGQIFKESMPMAHKIYMTRVHTELEGDTVFPKVNEQEWKKIFQLDFTADDKHAYGYSFETWARK
ncbi:MAG: diacylglycerol kinase [Bacteroidetes bacterium]|nr:MAG: diacylglycerol kinase [Bacteroidota bacterium]